MSNYTKLTDFASKDALATGNALKRIKGTEIDDEFDAIATAIATKTDNNAAAITGGSISGITDLAVADGGTGASTAAGARTNLGAAASGANSDITSLSGLTTALSVTQGGTGATHLGLNQVLLGGGDSAVQGVAPSTSGNLLTSNGTTWESQAPAAIGIGQTWQSFSSPARQSGVTYTNNTSKPIMVSVSLGAATTGASFSVVVGGVTIASGTIYSNWITHSFIVPVGTTYVVTCSTLSWAELR